MHPIVSCISIWRRTRFNPLATEIYHDLKSRSRTPTTPIVSIDNYLKLIHPTDQLENSIKEECYIFFCSETRNDWFQSLTSNIGNQKSQWDDSRILCKKRTANHIKLCILHAEGTRSILVTKSECYSRFVSDFLSLALNFRTNMYQQ